MLSKCQILPDDRRTEDFRINYDLYLLQLMIVKMIRELKKKRKRKNKQIKKVC